MVLIILGRVVLNPVEKLEKGNKIISHRCHHRKDKEFVLVEKDKSPKRKR